MARLLCGALIAIFLAAPMAFAQEGELAATRYMGCRAASDGVDQRLHEICELIDEINGLMPGARGQPRRLAQLRQSHASALFIIGDTGDDVAMRDAIVVARLCAEHYDREHTPSRWAALQSTIGQAQTYLGYRGDAEARQAAPETLSAAIAAIRRDRQPDLWASLQVSLANAYIGRGVGSDPDDLRRAAAALQASLEIYRGPRYAERRPGVERRLAEVYRALGEEPDAT